MNDDELDTMSCIAHFKKKVGVADDWVELGLSEGGFSYDDVVSVEVNNDTVDVSAFGGPTKKVFAYRNVEVVFANGASKIFDLEDPFVTGLREHMNKGKPEPEPEPETDTACSAESDAVLQDFGIFA